MCPLWPLHIFILYGLLLAPLWIVSAATSHMKSQFWNVTFEPATLTKVPIDSIKPVYFETSDLTSEEIKYGEVDIDVENRGIQSVFPVDRTYILNTQAVDGRWSSTFNISTNFLGYATARLHLRNKTNGQIIKSSNPLNITVIRRERMIDKAFTYSVATLVSIIYINFGCALDIGVVNKTIKRPVGPVIGFIAQFIFMPLISFGLAKVLFPQSIAMQLGMFFTGVSPAGGASNIWTVTLGGNMNLSITMTTISTFAAFVMIPLWIFTLGQLIFAAGNITIPYSRIGTIATGLIVPLGIGLLLQKFFPKISKFMARILRPFSLILIIFIIVFAIVTNYYIFQLFSWKIVVAGLGLPWLGFVFGATFAQLLRQSPPDVLAIAIETGIQNTGIAIFMLRFSLEQPEADLTTVVPVAVAIMTPLPLAVWFIIRKWHNRQLEKKTPRLETEAGEPARLTPLSKTNFDARADS